MKRAKEKQEKAIAEGTYKRKIAFTKLNKFMVKTKMSKSGFWIICTLAPLIVSIPLGTIIVAKFYREKALTYPVAVISLIVWAFVLAYLNGAIFSMFKQ
jgi:FtsH-binding integral membrane protein